MFLIILRNPITTTDQPRRENSKMNIPLIHSGEITNGDAADVIRVAYSSLKETTVAYQATRK
mgnify:CR=1 FL=1